MNGTLWTMKKNPHLIVTVLYISKNYTGKSKVEMYGILSKGSLSHRVAHSEDMFLERLIIL